MRARRSRRTAERWMLFKRPRGDGGLSYRRTTLTLDTIVHPIMSTQLTCCLPLNLFISRSARARGPLRMPSSLVTVQRQQEHSFLATEVPVEEYELEGTPIRPGRLHELSARGRTFKSTFHPLLSQGQCWISEKHVSVLSQSSFIVIRDRELSNLTSREQVSLFFRKSFSYIRSISPIRHSHPQESRYLL